MIQFARRAGVLFLMALTLSFQAHAFIVATLGDTNIDYHRPTALIVAGQGHDLGTLFMQSAVGYAYKMKKTYPQQQMVLISVTENSTEEDTAFFKDHGMQIVEADGSTLSKRSFVDYMTNYQRISSLQIFSHGSVAYGIQLESKYRRISENYSGIENLRGHFTDDAYAILYGCNTGWLMAIALAPTLGIPVAGAFSSTDFHQLGTDGEFYINESASLPSGVRFASSGSSYQNLRMTPDNHDYTGMWGNFSAGLGFYKFFCPQGNLTSSCQKAMAHWATTIISNQGNTLGSKQKFADSLKDFMCPNTKNPSTRQTCFTKMEQAVINNTRSYTPYNGTSISCNWQKCEFNLNCRHFLWKNIGHCDATSTTNGGSTAFMDQYKAILDGYDLLSQ